MQTARTPRRWGSWIAVATVGILLLPAVAPAQYLKRHDPTIPRTPDGKPDLDAPVPRTADGRPDLNGLWDAVDGKFHTNNAQRAGFTAPFTPAGAAADPRLVSRHRE
jgi:hypothetical protein